MVVAVGGIGPHNEGFPEMPGKHSVIGYMNDSALSGQDRLFVPAGFGAAAGGVYIGYQQGGVPRVGESEHAIAV